jgi:HK97 family phage major capsid protein
LHKVPALTHASGELLGRSPGYGRYIWKALARKVKNKTEAFIMQGTGMDQPLGLLNGPCLVTVTASDSTATAIGKHDVATMASRLLAGSYPTAIWVMHSTCLPSVMELASYNGNAATAYGYGSLLGRPVVVTEHANVLGAKGDLLLVDPAGYLYGLDGPLDVATAGFAFDQNLESFRSTLYMGGVPLLSAAVPRRTGTDTLSVCVALAARS